MCATQRSSALVLALLAIVVGPLASAQTYEIVQERNGIVNALARMHAGKAVTIAYLGGSITAGAGASQSDKTSWRALTTAWFQRQFPKSHIIEVNASIGGTGSDLGAFRLQQDVLAKKPDLIFIEFAVNDTGMPAVTVNRAIEGIVRHIRTADPTTEICFVYTLAQSMLPDYNQGKLPQVVFLQDVIAAHYHISSVNVGAAAADQINSNKLAWVDFSKDVCHPTDAGYAMYADTLTAFLAQQLLHISRQPVPYRLVAPLQPNCWSHGQLVQSTLITAVGKGWKTEAAVHDLPEVLAATDPSAEPLEYHFKGDTIGVCFILGPDTGNLDYRIDGSDWQALRPFDSFALDGPRLQYRILADNLSKVAHTVVIRPRTDKDEHSKGTVTRLAYFMTNES